MNERGQLNVLGINPGQLRHRITLLVATNSTGASGLKTTYAAGAPPVKAWSKIEQLRGTEVIRDGQDVSQTYLKVTMRYNAAFTAQARIAAPNGNQYVIQSVENPFEMNAYMILNCAGVGKNN